MAKNANLAGVKIAVVTTEGNQKRLDRMTKPGICLARRSYPERCLVEVALRQERRESSA
jgi:hypothetical protein